MPNIVILGSLSLGEYKVLAPHIMSEEYYTDHEMGYKKACEVFYPAIDEADVVFVFAPKGMGKHTKADLQYAIDQGKEYIIFPKTEETHTPKPLVICGYERQAICNVWKTEPCHDCPFTSQDCAALRKETK